MVRKKIILALLASAMMFTALAPHTIAAETSYVNGSVVPMYENDCDLTSILAIVGAKATCRSTAAGNTLKSITATQTIEKHWGLWIWNEVDGASWSKTVKSSNLSMSNTKSGLDSGTYRLRTDFTVTSTSGSTETITVYSQEKTI
jgi:hypothetical protein